MNRNHKLIAGTAVVALIAGGGAAFAAMKLVDSHPSSSFARPPAHMGVGRFGLGGRLGGRGFGGGLGGGQQAPRRGFGFGAFSAGALGSLTTYLGISSSQLQSDLGKGQTLASIAKGQGKSVDGLVAALVAARKTQLDAEVAAGRLTSAQEQQIESSEATRIRALVNGVGPHGPGGPGAGGGSGTFGAGSAIA